MQPVAVTDVPTPKEPDQSVTNDLHQSSDGVGMRADQKQEPTLHHPVVHELKLESPVDDGSSSQAGLNGTV